MNRLGLFALFLFVLPACRGAMHHDPVRAVWVTRFDYQSEDDIRQVMGNCADLGFNTVMFQVRGNGTAFFDSSYEPWADELGGVDPGYDPLQVAVDFAHEHEMSLHAWVNAIPSWRGDAPPSNPDQLYLAHPEWHWFDRDGQRQPLVSGFYVSLNPCLPEVRAYLTDTLAEIVEEYDVDGLHLDYVRFVDDLIEKGKDYPRDEATLALYRRFSGQSPDDDPEMWKRWKAQCITELVVMLRDRVHDANSEAWLSTAVGATPEGPLDRHQRNSRLWVEEDHVDAVFPMNYTADLALFRKRNQAWATYRDQTRIVTGINIPLDRDLSLIESEVRDALANSRDLCAFAYSYLFDPKSPGSAGDRGARAARRELLRPYLARSEMAVP